MNVTLATDGIAALVVCSSGCSLSELSVSNSDSSRRFLALFDCAWISEWRSLTPIVFGPVFSGRTFTASFGGGGLRFSSGLVVALIRPPPIRKSGDVMFGRCMMITANVQLKESTNATSHDRMHYSTN